MNGNFSFTRNFNNDSLALQWIFLRTLKSKWYSLEENKGFLTMQTHPETVMGASNPSFIGHRQQHLQGEVLTSFSFSTHKSNEKAGLIAFQNETHFYYICKSSDNLKSVVQLYKGTNQGIELLKQKLISSGNEEIEVKIEAKNGHYNFLYKDNNDWKILDNNVDGKYLSTKVAGGFVGVTYGLYTTSSGKNSDNKLKVDWFKYIGNDKIYKE